MLGYELHIKEDNECENKEIIAKIGGEPTYMPDNAEDIIDYFVMEIYNSKIIGGREDILCWQIYQDMEFGGIIAQVIEIKKGAKPYIQGSVPLRRWINEYDVVYVEKEYPEDLDDDEMEFNSMIKGNPGENIIEDCEYLEAEYVGVIYEDLCPYSDFSFGTGYIVLGMVDGTLVVE